VVVADDVLVSVDGVLLDVGEGGVVAVVFEVEGLGSAAPPSQPASSAMLATPASATRARPVSFCLLARFVLPHRDPALAGRLGESLTQDRESRHRRARLIHRTAALRPGARSHGR